MNHKCFVGQIISLQPLALKGRIKLSLIPVCHCPYFYCLTVQAQAAAAIQLSVTGKEKSVPLWTDTAAQKVAAPHALRLRGGSAHWARPGHSPPAGRSTPELHTQSGVLHPAAAAPCFSSVSLPLSGNRPPEGLCLLHP